MRVLDSNTEQCNCFILIVAFTSCKSDLILDMPVVFLIQTMRSLSLLGEILGQLWLSTKKVAGTEIWAAYNKEDSAMPVQDI